MRESTAVDHGKIAARPQKPQSTVFLDPINPYAGYVVVSSTTKKRQTLLVPDEGIHAAPYVEGVDTTVVPSPRKNLASTKKPRPGAIVNPPERTVTAHPAATKRRKH